MFKKMKSKKFKVAVVVLLCTLAISTTATAAWKMLSVVDPKLDTSIISTVKSATDKINELRQAVNARTNERNNILNTANKRIDEANKKINTANSKASDLASSATSLKNAIDASESQSTNADLQVVDVTDKPDEWSVDVSTSSVPSSN
ncbi:hypothetical protein [Weissella soli]|uniref:hypothetical protein n=1 Tax=Weissella soli TaxID=155866 RepID=UPI00359F9163